MNTLALILLSISMSTDAFAVALGKGATYKHLFFWQTLKIGLVFGLIEGMTPIIGWLIGSAANKLIAPWDHWIAFGILAVLGIQMIWQSYKEADKNPKTDKISKTQNSLLTTIFSAVATSIDALAIGVSLAFMEVNIYFAAIMIGCSTFLFVILGMNLGKIIGNLIGKWAGIIGGITLILIGLWIGVENI